MSEPRVIVLDGERTASLAVVRSLGARGGELIVGSHLPDPLTGRSRYASRSFRYPHPIASPLEFRRVLIDVADAAGGVELAIPLSEGTVAALAEGRAEWEGRSRIALAPNGALAVVLSTAALLELASKLDVPTPSSVRVHSLGEGHDAARKMGFPVVVAPDSRVSRAAMAEAGGARCAIDQAELERALTRILWAGPAQLCRPVGGEGVALAVLCRGGSVRWAFQYCRWHELGPNHDASGYRVSERIDPQLLKWAGSLMGELRWEGAAELHFRRDVGGYCLTKINATFAESLPVAAAAGVDAARFLCDLELRQIYDFTGTYRIGVRCRHLPSEVAWTRDLMRPPACAIGDRPSATRVLTDLATTLNPRERWETQSVSDPRPGLRELRQMGSTLWQGVVYRRLRFRQRRRMQRAVRRPAEIVALVQAAHTIMFVCHGNIIRSAFAARLLGVRDAGRSDLCITSSGTEAATGHAADSTAMRCAQRFGVDLTGHRARRIDRQAVEQADIVLTMELDHAVEVCRRFPQYEDKVYVFGCLIDETAPDVADPVYAPAGVFDACFDAIERGIRRIVTIRASSGPLR